MSNRKFYEQRAKQDHAGFVKVLRALPADKLDYKPHERSTSAGDLAWQLAEELRVLSELDANGNVNWEAAQRPSSLDEIVAAYEQHADRLHTLVGTMDDARWDSEARFLFG